MIDKKSDVRRRPPTGYINSNFVQLKLIIIEWKNLKATRDAISRILFFILEKVKIEGVN